MKSQLQLQQVSNAYQRQQVLQQVDLEVSGDEILCILGPSGSGKSTVLKAAAGLLPINSGRIQLNDQVLSDQDTHVAPQKRSIGLIFQDYALFPHMTVRDNIGFSDKASDAEIEQLVALLSLQGLEQRYPHEISGGQQQRVAIARAMAYQPEFLLMDEPFSNIDQQTRWPLIRELHGIFKQRNMGVVFVTHSIDEAFYLADRVAVLDGGRILQCDTPEVLYKKPDNLAVAQFLDLGMCLPILSQHDSALETSLGSIDTSHQEVSDAENTHVFITPDYVQVSASEQGFQIQQKQRLAHGISYDLKKENETIRLTLPVAQDFAVGAVVDVQIKPHDPWVLRT